MRSMGWRTGTGRAVSALLLLAACGDSPSDPGATAGGGTTPASLEIIAGQDQTGTAGAVTSIAPVVVVQNAAGAPLAGITVAFRVTAGGGTVTPATTVTDAEGRATVAAWRLGALPGANELEASVASIAVRFTAVAESPWGITVRYVGTPTARQQLAVARAVQRWRTLVLSELSDVVFNAAAGDCFASQPTISETIDDLLLYVEFANIDGQGKVLGQAGPCYIRSENGLPLLGFLRLDAADLVRMETIGTLDDLVLHEIGHIIGFGTIWRELGLLTGEGSADPRFSGVHALAAYRLIDASVLSVPVENTGTIGTRDGHWRESVFENELMTGYLSGTPNPLSAITVGSLQDMGYTSNTSAADAFPVLSVTSQAADTAIDFSAHEIVMRPRFRIDRRGNRTTIGS